jgi:hypothetical protein
MGKLIGLILIVAVVYGGWEIHSKGTEKALGGIFASSQNSPESSSDSKRTHKSRVTRMGQLGPVDGID